MTQGKSILRTPHWRKVVRPAVLERDGYQCQIKLPGTWRTRGQDNVHCLGTADQVHHTKGIWTGYDMAYLVASCGPCNRKVGKPKGEPDPPAKLDRSW
jgi:hypothetical protein